MKALLDLYQAIGIQLNAKYYVSFLDKEETEVITQAVKKKKPLVYQMNVLRLLALKIITELKRSASFQGESQWQTAFAAVESALLAEQKDPRDLCQSLHQADDLIETAWVTRAVRRNILTAVQQRSILSESQDRQYEVIRQAYLTHNEALNVLDEQVYQIKNRFFQSSARQTTTAAPAWHMVRRDLPSTVLNYRADAYRIRLSDQNVVRLIHAEKDARSVYQDLVARLVQKPTVEKIAEEIESAKVFLTEKAKTINHNAEQIRHTILQETQQAIEHRTQIKLAHANKIEYLLTTLEKITRLLQPHLSLQQPTPCLSALLTEAKAMQGTLENSPYTAATSTLTQHVLALESHRQHFAQSISSSWSCFFSSERQAHRRRAQKLNTELQSAIAQMTTPLYGFNDQSAVITPDQVKQQHLTARQLDEKQDHAVLEREKIEKIKNTFSQ